MKDNVRIIHDILLRTFVTKTLLMYCLRPFPVTIHFIGLLTDWPIGIPIPSA